MNDRDKRLLPRFLGVLSSNENDAEVLQAVQQLRRVLAADGKQISDLTLSPEQNADGGEPFTLRDERHDVSTRIRQLGLMLRLATAITADVQRRFEHVAVAMITGLTITSSDMRFMLACLSDVIRQKHDELERARFQARQRQMSEDLYRPEIAWGPPRFNSPHGTTTYTNSPAGAAGNTPTREMLDEMMRDALKAVHQAGGWQFRKDPVT